QKLPTICVTAIYIPLMLFGLLGNILTILVVWLRPHMRSSTYLYLSSMAVSDLLILLLLPLDLYKLWRPRPWPLGDLVCKVTMFLSECCTFCTILHITCLSLERYLAVCWPITAKTVVTRRRTRSLIGCLWLAENPNFFVGTYTKATAKGRCGNIHRFLQNVYCFRVAYCPFESLRTKTLRL
uniref:G-protein coupled receptors family 1 profile domain-containing protein n=1 Tax=Scophthalmus maximus TaxID=52904 RepID=A0A8D2ZG74_SCOMX